MAFIVQFLLPRSNPKLGWNQPMSYKQFVPCLKISANYSVTTWLKKILRFKNSSCKN